MIPVIFRLGETDPLDLGPWLSTFEVVPDKQYLRVVTTLDGTEWPYQDKDRMLINFSLIPLEETQIRAVRAKLAPPVVYAEYWDPNSGRRSGNFRPMNDLSAAFALLSQDRKLRYRCGAVQLREL